MIRFGELALLIAPAALFVAWRLLGPERFAPSNRTLAILFAALALLGIGMAWTGVRERHAEGTAYVPAQYRDGRVVPGHGG